jgi:putative MATE family efflux protein
MSSSEGLPQNGQGSVATAPKALPEGSMGGGRLGRARRDLTTGSIRRHLWYLAWPQVIEGVLGIMDQLVDMVWAGRLPGGFHALAGLGVAQTFTQFGQMARQGLDQAARAMITRAVGAGNIRLANHIALQAFVLTGVYAVLLIILGLLLTDILIRFIGAGAVQAEAALYMRIQFIGIAGMSFRMASTAVLQSTGDVFTPLKSTAVTRVIHIVVTPFFMFGWFGLPAFGLAGAALSNLLAQLVGAGINFWVLFRGGSFLRLTLRDFHLDYPVMGRMLKIGAPASIGGTERAISQLVLLWVVAPFGIVALAAFGLTRRMEMLANFGSMGIAQASGIMVGQNLGAGRPERARQSVGWALVFAAAMKLVVAALLLLFPVLMVMAFTQDPAVVDLTADWLRILGLAAVFMGIGVVFQQSFNVAGDTVTVAIVTFIALVAIELPAAWLLSYPMGVGPLGSAWANVIGMVVRAALFVPVYYWGRWLRIKVID